jgi:circadian clock protein KaiC
MVSALTRAGVTVFMTVEVPESFTDLRVSTDLISFLTDDVIHQRYVEIEGQMRKVMTVIKMRGSAHSKDLRLYDVTLNGLVLGNTLYDYRGTITGVAQRHQSNESEDADLSESILRPVGDATSVPGHHEVGDPPAAA